MIYEPNTTQWKRGDVVIHDADAKETKMLMRIVGFARSGMALCQYIDRRNPRKLYMNELKYLHDPARFNIEVK